eukprot:TRINITY_DN462_c0_g1_i2.p1 TRINITY_DN462_c0_g1~~TRINITY_DN462_c0_g1_i2.p1  ORF type:complete len:255 (-),score=62.05 TRINITY_DN462_c0_g1_i2:63-827(-)
MATFMFGAGFSVGGAAQLVPGKKNEFSGVFQIDNMGKTVRFLRGGSPIYTISFGDIVEAKVDKFNEFKINLAARGQPNAELHTQSEAECRKIESMLQTAKRNLPVHGEAFNKGDAVLKGWCTRASKKPGGSRRYLVLGSKGTLAVYKDEASPTPTYILMLHDRLTANSVFDKMLSVIGSFKSLTLTFADGRERDQWQKAIVEHKLPPPQEDHGMYAGGIQASDRVSYMPADGKKVYMKQLIGRGTAPAGPSGHW